MKNPLKYYTLLFLIFILFTGNLLFWQSHNIAYFNYDSLRHYLRSLYIFDAYRDGFESLFLRIKQYPGIHPPLVHIITSLFYFLILPTQQNAVLINTSISLIVLLFSLYNLGKVIKDEKLGILSCVIILLYPVVFNQAKIYMLDLPLLSVVILNIYFLIRTDYFKNKKYAILFMLSCFMGIMIKPFFLFYTIGPFLYVSYNVARNKKISLFFLLILSMVFVGLFTFYIINSSVQMKTALWLLIRFNFSRGLPAWTPENLKNVSFIIGMLRSLLWYIWGFINWQAGFLFFVLFLWGLFRFLVSNNPYKKIIIIWLLSSYFILSWFISGVGTDMEVTAIRYSMPLLASIALMSSYGLIDLGKRFLRRSVIGFVILYGVLNTLILSYPVLKTPFILKINLRQDKYLILPSYINIYSAKPLIISGSNWLSQHQDKSLIYKEIENVFLFINNFYKGKKIEVLLLSDTPDWRHLKYLSYKHNKNIIFFCDYLNLLQGFYASLFEKNELQDKKFDFIIAPKEDFTESYLVWCADEFKKYFKTNRNNYTLIKEDAFCKIFKRKI